MKMSSTRSPRKVSWVWQFFEKKDSELAKCVICHKEYSFKSTSNLKKHLDTQHDTCGDGTLDEFPDSVDREPSVDLCDEYHLKTEDVPEEVCSGGEDEVTSETRVSMKKKTSRVWPFFKCIDNKFASCLVCSRKLSYATTVSNLRKHLRSKHADIAAEILFENTKGATERDSSEDERGNVTEDSVYSPMEEVFLQSAPASETASNDRRPVKRPFTVDRPRNSVASTTRKRSKATAEENGPALAGDEIEHFGRYVTVLLRQLPRSLAARMQMEIVTLIMKAQLEYEAKEKAVGANKVETSDLYHEERTSSDRELHGGENI